MNDRFKFRIFSKTAKKFIYFDKSELSIDRENMGLLFRSEYLYLGNYEELQQCTGLKDKNGTLIYEGDIVKFKTELFGKPKQIIWDECHYILKDTFIILCNTEIEQFGLKVIGNAYENPELLSY